MVAKLKLMENLFAQSWKMLNEKLDIYQEFGFSQFHVELEYKFEMSKSKIISCCGQSSIAPIVGEEYLQNKIRTDQNCVRRKSFDT